MDLRNGRMRGEHFTGVAIHQRIDLQVRGVVLQNLKNRRSEQHIAVVPELDHQGAMQ